MVELKLETVDFDNSAADTYVAVRIGEVQKLSRLSSERNFKFPQSALGERKFGKVDIFKRVGSVSIGIRNEPEVGVQELNVALNTGTNINLRVTLGGDAAPASDKPAMVSTSVAEAKNYLTEHNLEVLLSDAMQAVLREKPANPRQFIADKLANSDGNYRRVPGDESAQTVPGESRPAAEPQEGGAKPDTEVLRQQAKATLLAATADGKLDVTLAKMKGTQIAPEGEVSAEAKEGESKPDTESLRQQAKATLLAATKDGKLDGAVAKRKEAQAAAGEVSAESAPAEAAPEVELSAELAPADAAPEGEVSAEPAPADAAPEGEVSAEPAPADAAPEGEVSAELAPAE